MLRALMRFGLNLVFDFNYYWWREDPNESDDPLSDLDELEKDAKKDNVIYLATCACGSVYAIGGGHPGYCLECGKVKGNESA